MALAFGSPSRVMILNGVGHRLRVAWSGERMFMASLQRSFEAMTANESTLVLTVNVVAYVGCISSYLRQNLHFFEENRGKCHVHMYILLICT
jgi:hypothetical protein